MVGEGTRFGYDSMYPFACGMGTCTKKEKVYTFGAKKTYGKSDRDLAHFWQ